MHLELSGTVATDSGTRYVDCGSIRIESERFATKQEAEAVLAQFPKYLRGAVETIYCYQGPTTYQVRWEFMFLKNRATGGKNETSAARFRKLQAAAEKAGFELRFRCRFAQNCIRDMAEALALVEFHSAT